MNRTSFVLEQLAWGELTALELLTWAAVVSFLGPRVTLFWSVPQERRLQTRVGEIGSIVEYWAAGR
jgi:hypothetical protein